MGHRSQSPVIDNVPQDGAVPPEPIWLKDQNCVPFLQQAGFLSQEFLSDRQRYVEANV